MRARYIWQAALACLPLAFLVPVQAGEPVWACAVKASGNLRIVAAPSQCRPSEQAVALASPAPVPDLLPLNVLHLQGLRGATGEDANVVPFTPSVVIRASLRSDGDSRSHIRVRAAHAWELDARYRYDGFYICLSFSQEIPDDEPVTVLVLQSRHARATLQDPITTVNAYARLNRTVGDFRNGTPVNAGSLAQCLTARFSDLPPIAVNAFEEQLVNLMEPPGLFSMIITTPEMLATKPSGPTSLEGTFVHALGLTVAGPASLP